MLVHTGKNTKKLVLESCPGIKTPRPLGYILLLCSRFIINTMSFLALNRLE